jgi:AcrR family transcriptional regulator
MARAMKAADPDNGKSSAAPGARERILDTAEQLFAREGVMAVTLRSIAAAADVNVAAVNYYFGTKEKLFEEMFVRRVAPLNEERLARLKNCIAQARGKPSLEGIVEAYVLPAAQLADTSSSGARAIIVQYSLGRILAMPQADGMLVRYYDRLRKEYVAALQQALPDLAPHEVVWRYYWMGGCLMCALAVPPGMVEPPTEAGEGVRPGLRESMADSLIGFLVTGFRSGARDADPRAVA